MAQSHGLGIEQSGQAEWMMMDHYANEASKYLEKLCEQIDKHEPLRRGPTSWLRAAAIPAAIGVSLFACSGLGKQSSSPSATAEVCDNGVDDDLNGAVDCEDPVCKDAPFCNMVALYAAPPEVTSSEVPREGVDCSPRDGRDKSQGTDCSSGPVRPSERCGNGIDDDGNGLVDGEDPACGSTPSYPGAEYAAPMPEPLPSRNPDPPVALYAGPPNLR